MSTLSRAALVALVSSCLACPKPAPSDPPSAESTATPDLGADESKPAGPEIFGGEHGAEIFEALEPEPEPEDAVDESTREALVTTIRGYLPDLQACYETELPRDSSLAGKMTYTITVEPAGEVSAVVVELDTVEDALVRQCAVAMIGGWTFVAADIEEPSEVTFSVRFTAV